jgi:23S rRNA (cytidine1920-2'-O)/16S rRNA (cytidine1409-2'-O)-methyltransferase
LGGAKKERADKLLVIRGLAQTEAEAGALLLTGRVMASEPDRPELKVDKAGTKLDPASSFRLTGEVRRFVSRGGLKLEGALDALQIDPRGRVCADLGLSTGGFTDCLLKRGALRVHGVDVGYGLVDWKLRGDPRLVLHERTNARQLAADALGERVTLLVADLSFISLVSVLPAMIGQCAPGADLLLLVKPQFELDREEVGSGVVADPALRQKAIARVKIEAERLGLRVKAGVDSTISGADGNVEHLLHLVMP